MSLLALLSLVPICLLGAMSPGPSLVVVVRHTLGGGRGNGIVCAWAHSIGIGVYALVTLLGLAVLLKVSPVVFKGISIAGAVFLAWLGYKALTSKGSAAKKLEAGQKTSALAAARDGLGISLFNPKILLFFLALFSQFVVEAKNIWGQVAIVITPVVIDGMWYTVIATVLSNRNVLPKLQKNATLIDRLSGIVLLLLALRVVVKLF